MVISTGLSQTSIRPRPLHESRMIGMVGAWYFLGDIDLYKNTRIYIDLYACSIHLYAFLYTLYVFCIFKCVSDVVLCVFDATYAYYIYLESVSSH